MNPLRCITLLVFSTTIPIAAQDVLPPASDCPFSLEQMHKSGPELWHRLSQDAELVAPAAAAPASSAGTSRRHAVAPVPGLPFVSRNFIDDEIFGKMVKDGVHWTTRSSDAEFLRRVTLDL